MFNPANERDYLKAIRRYQAARPDFDLLAGHLKKLLAGIARDLGIYPIIMGRAKSLESFAEKIVRPGKSYPKDPLAEMTDLCGVRVVTHTRDEVDAFAGVVSQRFRVDLAHSEDKEERLAYREFGYLSKHFIVQLKETPDLAGCSPEQLKRLRDYKAELQLRTLAQHTWADVYHELGYKNEFRLPARFERDFYRVAAMLESCDKVFRDVKDTMQGYAAGHSAYMDGAELKALAQRLRLLLRVDTENVQLVHRLIRTYLALSRWTAIDRLVKARRPLLSSYPPALRDIGVARIQAHGKQPQSAEFLQGQEDLKKAVDSDPTDVDALCSLAGSYKKQDDRARALERYREACRLDPTNPYPLGNRIALELLDGNTQVIDYLRPMIRQAAERCRKQAEVRVNLPWALFDLGLFHLYLGEPFAGLSFYARGIENAPAGWMLQTANRTVETFLEAETPIQGLAPVHKLLNLARWLTSTAKEKKDWPWRPAPGPAPLKSPVFVLAGGCGGLESEHGPRLAALAKALTGIRGTLVSGGTLSGVARIPGDLVERGGRLRAVGYLPETLPGGVKADHRCELRRTSASDFSPLEPLAFWEHFLAGGGNPKKVKLIAFNGGDIAACEFRIALALGASVGVVRGSGRKADELLMDPLWKDHPRLRPLKLRRGDVARFLSRA